MILLARFLLPTSGLWLIRSLPCLGLVWLTLSIGATLAHIWHRYKLKSASYNPDGYERDGTGLFSCYG